MTRARVEEFLYHEADLLDSWRLDEWLELFDADAKYEVPSNTALDGDPATDLMLIDDNYQRMRARVERLNSRRAHREFPHSRTNHQVANVRFRVEDDIVTVDALFTVWRFRHGREGYYVGKYRYRLRPVGDEFRIQHKRIELDMTDLYANGDVAIIL
ncbi:aromatic-ring-hydroxylating dioxygenase subunit beta [Mycobacterium sp. AT1]|nr:aromatic-ring-hydroxylating dioxygenase subunit beta [Mycobacterium sp. AT1]